MTVPALDCSSGIPSVRTGPIAVTLRAGVQDFILSLAFFRFGVSRYRYFGDVHTSPNHALHRTPGHRSCCNRTPAFPASVSLGRYPFFFSFASLHNAHRFCAAFRHCSGVRRFLAPRPAAPPMRPRIAAAFFKSLIKFYTRTKDTHQNIFLFWEQSFFDFPNA